MCMKAQSNIKSGIDALSKVRVANTSIVNKHWYDKLSNSIADFLTSVLLIMIVTITFLIGITTHIYAVFGDWWLAVGYQFVVLLTSVNSDLLPKYKNIPLIAVFMSCFTCVFVFLSFDGHLSTGIMLLVNALKSLAIALVEFIFAYLFVARNNRTKAEQAGIQFDFEGNVIEQRAQQDAAQVEDAEVLPADNEPVHVEEEQLIVVEPVWQPKRCHCGFVADSEDAWNDHIANCDVYKFFESSAK